MLGKNSRKSSNVWKTHPGFFVAKATAGQVSDSPSIFAFTLRLDTPAEGIN